MNRNKYLSSIVRSCFGDRSFSFLPPVKEAYPSRPGRIQQQYLHLFGKALGKSFPPPPSFRQFCRFFQDGDRSEYEGVYFQRRRMLTAAALYCWSDPQNGESLTVLEDILWSVCQEYTWALPAHLVRGGADPGAPHDQLLDLFNCETAFALAEIRFLLADRLSPVLSEQIKKQINRRVLAPYSNAPFGTWKWETLENNWSAVCASSIGSAALYLLEGEDLKRILQKLIPSLEYYLRGFGNEGISLEGLGYWTYGWYFYVSFSDLLHQRTGGRIDLLDLPLCGTIAEFQQKCYLTESLSVSFSDSSLEERYRPGLAAFLAKRFSGVQIPPDRLRLKEEDYCGRWAPAFRDVLWSGEDLAFRTDKEFGQAVHFFRESQWVIAPAGDGGLGFAARGGNNDEPHNQNDLGSFILASGDQAFLCDPGAGLYTSRYFGEGQYDILCKSSRGHSVPLVGGRTQEAGPSYRSDLLEAEESKGIICFRLNLTGAYPAGLLERLTRQFQFFREDRILELEDSYRSRLGITERFVSFLKPEIRGEEILLNTPLGHMRILCLSGGKFDTLLEMIHTDHQGMEVPLWAMDFDCPPSEEGIFRIQFQYEEY